VLYSWTSAAVDSQLTYADELLTFINIWPFLKVLNNCQLLNSDSIQPTRFVSETSLGWWCGRGRWHVWGRRDMHTNFWWGNLKARDNLHVVWIHLARD